MGYLFLKRLAPALLALLLCSGCGNALLPFTTPEEQREAQEAAQAARLELQAQADPALALGSPLVIRRQLTNSQGVVLAEYTVELPQFSTAGQKAQSFQRINDYYRNELAGLSQDADSLFAAAKAHYGEGWDTVTEADGVYAVRIGYVLLDAPEGYLCVRCDFRVEEGGQQEDYSRAQVFLLDNGWVLSLSTLLGGDYETAAPQLLADLLNWCEEQEVEVTSPEERTLEEFSDGYALTTEGFLFYTQPFQLTRKNPERYTIPVALTPYRRMLDLD